MKSRRPCGGSPKAETIESKTYQNQRVSDTDNLKAFIKNMGIDLLGVADLQDLKTMPTGLPSKDFLRSYRYAIVVGLQLDKPGPNTSGKAASIFLEKAALEILSHLEKKGCHSLIIHTEDEFDPTNRIGLMSLKVLAKAAGLGWQGRSLLIISPEYGPIHRLIAVITDMDLQPDMSIPNRCSNCVICVQNCPTFALSVTSFEDHPEYREDVLNLNACLGDEGCNVCMITCPFVSENTDKIKIKI